MNSSPHHMTSACIWTLWGHTEHFRSRKSPDHRWPGALTYQPLLSFINHGHYYMYIRQIALNHNAIHTWCFTTLHLPCNIIQLMHWISCIKKIIYHIQKSFSFIWCILLKWSNHWASVIKCDRLLCFFLYSFGFFRHNAESALFYWCMRGQPSRAQALPCDKIWFLSVGKGFCVLLGVES